MQRNWFLLLSKVRLFDLIWIPVWSILFWRAIYFVELLVQPRMIFLIFSIFNISFFTIFISWLFNLMETFFSYFLTWISKFIPFLIWNVRNFIFNLQFRYFSFFFREINCSFRYLKIRKGILWWIFLLSFATTLRSITKIIESKSKIIKRIFMNWSFLLFCLLLFSKWFTVVKKTLFFLFLYFRLSLIKKIKAFIIFRNHWQILFLIKTREWISILICIPKITEIKSRLICFEWTFFWNYIFTFLPTCIHKIRKIKPPKTFFLTLHRKLIMRFVNVFLDLFMFVIGIGRLFWIFVCIILKRIFKRILFIDRNSFCILGINKRSSFAEWFLLVILFLLICSKWIWNVTHFSLGCKRIVFIKRIFFLLWYLGFCVKRIWYLASLLMSSRFWFDGTFSNTFVINIFDRKRIAYFWFVIKIFTFSV